MHDSTSRRDAIKVIGATAAGLMVGGGSVTAQEQVSAPRRRMDSEPSPSRGRVLRVAHLTDIHVQPERRAAEGMAAALHGLRAPKEPIDLILTGGDMVMDSFEADDARTQLQWDLWKKVLRDENSRPIEHCIGNHDIWGWNRRNSKTRGDEPNYGKKRAMENFGIDKPYRSFDRAGWRFIILDSTQKDGDGYKAFLDPEQYDWLQRTLKETDAGTPVLILSHIPILSASAVLWAKRDEDKSFTISGSLVHADGVKLKDLFAGHPNVKLCLSGHLHLVDRVDYNGVTYLCNGAVSGNWWKGKHKDCDEGYALIDLYNDGSFEHEYVKYGWQAES